MKKPISIAMVLLGFSLAIIQTGCNKDSSFNQSGMNGSDDLALKQSSDMPGQNLNIATTWIAQTLKTERTTTNWNGVNLSRAFGYIGIAMYQSMLPDMQGHATLVGQLNDLTSLPVPEAGLTYSFPLACNAAVAQMVRSLFANTTTANFTSIDSLEDANNAAFASLSPDVFNRSVAFGVSLANAIFDYSKTDGGDQSYNNLFPPEYVTPVGDQYWKPFGTQGPVPLLPYWGSNRSMVAGDIDPSLPGPPPAYSEDPSSEFYKQVYSVYNISKNRTTDQTNLALFWNDGAGTYSSVGHSLNILSQVMVTQNLNLKKAVIATARLGIALNDAVISCFKTKYTYSLVRPVTYIQAHIDATWLPLISTPAFPEYSSGHGTQSGAMATIMTSIFGENYAFTDYTHVPDGLGTRSFTSFGAAAREAATSRWLGGIHYTYSCEAALRQGSAVAKSILALNM